jgi:hypothetical protein
MAPSISAAKMGLLFLSFLLTVALLNLVREDIEVELVGWEDHRPSPGWDLEEDTHALTAVMR